MARGFTSSLVAVSVWLAAGSAWGCNLKIALNDNVKADPEQELVTLAAAKVGCTLEWRRVPNRRVLFEVENGMADAMLLFSFDTDRAKYAVYPMKDGRPDPAYRLKTLTYRIYVKNGSPLRWNGKKFEHLHGPIGVNAGFSVAPEIASFGAAVDEAPGTVNNINKLQLGRVAAYVMVESVADTSIAELQATDISKLVVPFSTKDYYLPVSKALYARSPELVHRLWREIAEIRRVHGADIAKK